MIVHEMISAAPLREDVSAKLSDLGDVTVENPGTDPSVAVLCLPRPHLRLRSTTPTARNEQIPPVNGPGGEWTPYCGDVRVVEPGQHPVDQLL
ncbi:hypothetical protein [Amycolatopsis balhimycina]|uniref:hypothetical protein n=1 Tax=Amycolatopsis balhimycina TaxID=208443 RepID=UPI0003A23EEC|nr:hypothetical protein [Amycolatopsis balhimycina]